MLFKLPLRYHIRPNNLRFKTKKRQQLSMKLSSQSSFFIISFRSTHPNLAQLFLCDSIDIAERYRRRIQIAFNAAVPLDGRQL
jgi:IS4 transposase